MGKGIIRVNTGNAPTPVKITTTVSYDTTVVAGPTEQYESTTPVGGHLTGNITDSQTGIVIPFEQPFGTEMGLVDGLKVNYTTVTVNGRVIANTVKILEKGVIESINVTNDGGTLRDKSTNAIIPFVHLYCRESGFTAPSASTKGSIVTFERVFDPRTAGPTATSLELK